MKTPSPIVRAIDVGFGNTKFTTKNYRDGMGCDLFPSIAPLTPAALLKNDEMLTGGRIVNVNVSGQTYTIGKDVRTASTTSTVRILDERYPESDVYLALVMGALYEMREETIDLLVLGLPMNTYSKFQLSLAKRMKGKHTIPNPARKKNSFAPAEITVTVKTVKVIPQAIGAFLNYSVHKGLNDALQNQLNLVVDVGRGTLDWFVSQGTQPIVARSGATFGGVAKIALTVAEREDPSLKDNQSIMDRIEAALHTKQPILISRKPVDIWAKHEGVIKKAITDPIQKMVFGLGELKDIDNILVTGGGSSLYMNELVNVFGAGEFIVDDEPIFANVKGFQLAGEQYLLQNPQVAAA